MALTTVARLRLESKGLQQLYVDHIEHWSGMAAEARALIAGQVPGGIPTTDDVRKILLPMVELQPLLRNCLVNRPKPLTQKYWISDFTDPGYLFNSGNPN
jgi:hypothetical protein